MSAATGKTKPGAPAAGGSEPPDPRRRFARDSALPAQGSLRWSFTWAFAGIVYAIRTQRNMQLHIAAVAIVLILGLALNLSRLEFVAVIAAISLVLVAEMFNTAIEAAVDAVVTDYHPLIKVAKDVAAGAVLIAAVNAIATAYLVFYSHISDPHHELSTGLHAAPTLLVAGAVLLTIVVVLVDQGGDRPGHAAAGRPAVGPRGGGVRRLDGDHDHRRPVRPRGPGLDAGVPDGAPGRPVARRGRHPFGRRGPGRRADRDRADDRRLPALGLSAGDR